MDAYFDGGGELTQKLVDKAAKRLGYNYDTATPRRRLKNCAVMSYKIFLWG